MDLTRPAEQGCYPPTHWHADHAGSATEVRAATGAPPFADGRADRHVTLESAAAPAGDLDRARSAADELQRTSTRFATTALVADAALARGRCASPSATRPVRTNPFPRRCGSGTGSALRTRRHSPA